MNTLRAIATCRFLTLFLATGVAPAATARIYVNAASTPTAPDGRSWATAFPTLQAGIDAAASGEDVWIAAGTYSREYHHKSTRALHMYGGFSGHEESAAQRPGGGPSDDPPRRAHYSGCCRGGHHG